MTGSLPKNKRQMASYKRKGQNKGKTGSKIKEEPLRDNGSTRFRAQQKGFKNRGMAIAHITIPI